MSVFSSIKKKWKGTALGAVAAPFTGGLSLAAGYLYDTNKQQNAANKKAVAQANAYDKYLWDTANAYNSPSQQMARLKAAGLNPNLVYGSGNVTGNTAGVAGSNGVVSTQVFDGLSKGLQTAQAVSNLRNTNSQNELLNYQMGQTAAQTRYAEARARDLENFLDGNGPTTYDRYRAPSSTVSEDPESSPVDYDSAFASLVDMIPWPSVRTGARGVLKFIKKNTTPRQREKAFDYMQLINPGTSIPYALRLLKSKFSK